MSEYDVESPRIIENIYAGFSNPLSPHDALKCHFTSLKIDLIFVQLGVFD